MLTIRISKSCVVAHFRVAHTTIFGVLQRLHYFLFFSRGIYYVFRSSEYISEGSFFTVSPKAKVPGEVVVGSGQNKILLWECDHWTKVRLRRDKSGPAMKKFFTRVFPIDIATFIYRGPVDPSRSCPRIQENSLL